MAGLAVGVLVVVAAVAWACIVPGTHFVGLDASRVATGGALGVHGEGWMSGPIQLTWDQGSASATVGDRGTFYTSIQAPTQAGFYTLTASQGSITASVPFETFDPAVHMVSPPAQSYVLTGAPAPASPSPATLTANQPGPAPAPVIAPSGGTAPAGASDAGAGVPPPASPVAALTASVAGPDGPAMAATPADPSSPAAAAATLPGYGRWPAARPGQRIAALPTRNAGRSSGDGPPWLALAALSVVVAGAAVGGVKLVRSRRS